MSGLVLLCLIVLVVSVDAYPFPSKVSTKLREKRLVDNVVKSLSEVIVETTQVLADFYSKASLCLETAGISKQEADNMTDEQKNSDPRFQNATICLQAKIN